MDLALRREGNKPLEALFPGVGVAIPRTNDLRLRADLLALVLSILGTVTAGARTFVDESAASELQQHGIGLLAHAAKLWSMRYQIRILGSDEVLVLHALTQLNRPALPAEVLDKICTMESGFRLTDLTEDVVHQTLANLATQEVQPAIVRLDGSKWISLA